MNKKLILLFIGVFLSAASTAYAAGDAAAGEAKAAVCGACHGSNGNSAVPNFPKLAGQFSDYIAKQLMDFRTGERSDPNMTGMAQGIASRQDIEDIAAYFASQETMKGSGGASATGEDIFNNGRADKGIYACVSCHGQDGRGAGGGVSITSFPVIGGQHKAYLVKQLKDFRSKGRSNDAGKQMRNVVAKMSDDEIDAVAEYLASL